MLSGGGSGARMIPNETTFNSGCSDSTGSEDETPNELFQGNLEGIKELSSDHNMKYVAAKFLLKMKEERKIAQTAVDGIVQDVTDLWDGAMKQVCGVSLNRLGKWVD